MSFHITDLQDSIDPIWHSIRQDEAQQELLDCTDEDDEN